MSFASTPIPIPINQQATPYRGDLTSNDVRVRQPSTSPAFASGSRGSFGTSPLDTRPRSYSTGEKYSYSNTKVQRRLSLDSRLQQSSGASALGDILNIDNIYNMLHLGEKSSVSTTASGSRKKARERERKSLDNKPILHTAISDNLSRDLRSFAVDSNREEQYMNNGTEIDKSVLFDASVTINESYPEYSDQPTDALVPVSFQSSDSTEYACNKSLPSSPFKTLIRHFEHQLPATELSDDASKLKHVLATLPLINGSHTVSDSNYLTALLGAANTNAFVLAISGAPELSTKSALSDSTEIAFPFGGEGDLVIENRADSTSDATAENKNSGQQPSFTSQDSVRQESNLDIIGNQPGNKSNYTGGNSTNSVAPYTQLVIAPQIESFVRHVEAFTSSVNQSLIDSSQEEDSLQHLSTQLNEFRQFRASVNQVRSI